MNGMQDALNAFPEKEDTICPKYIVKAGQVVKYYVPGDNAALENLKTAKVLRVKTAAEAHASGSPFTLVGKMEHVLTFAFMIGDSIQIKEPFQSGKGFIHLKHLRYEPGAS